MNSVRVAVINLKCPSLRSNPNPQGSLLAKRWRLNDLGLVAQEDQYPRAHFLTEYICLAVTAFLLGRAVFRFLILNKIIRIKSWPHSFNSSVVKFLSCCRQRLTNAITINFTHIASVAAFRLQSISVFFNISSNVSINILIFFNYLLLHRNYCLGDIPVAAAF